MVCLLGHGKKGGGVSASRRDADCGRRHGITRCGWRWPLAMLEHPPSTSAERDLGREKMTVWVLGWQGKHWVRQQGPGVASSRISLQKLTDIGYVFCACPQSGSLRAVCVPAPTHTSLKRVIDSCSSAISSLLWGCSAPRLRSHLRVKHCTRSCSNRVRLCVSS